MQQGSSMPVTWRPVAAVEHCGFGFKRLHGYHRPLPGRVQFETLCATLSCR
jgi:hypothetical protein